MGIIINEREFAEAAIVHSDLGEHPTETLSCVAKLYKQQGYKRAEVQEKLERFLIACDPQANIVKWQETLQRIVRLAFKYPMVEICEIPITQLEMDLCKSLRGVQRQRLMFTLICLARLANLVNNTNGNWVNRGDKEIFKLANVRVSQVRQSLMLNDLMTEGLIGFSKKVDNINIRVDCLDPGGAPKYKISDLRNLGFQYMKLAGHNYMECQSCGIVIPRRTNNQKYCPDCGAEENRQKTRKYWNDVQKVYRL